MKESASIHDIEEDIKIRINSCSIIKQENTKLGNIIGKLSGNKLRCGGISRHARPRSLVLRNKREGANPSISTNGAVVELVDTQDLKSCGPKGPCGFDSHPPYKVGTRFP